MRDAANAEEAFNALDHHTMDHLAGDPSCCCQPADDLAVMTVEDEGDADDLAIPAGELQSIGTPTDVRTDRNDLAVVLAWSSSAGMALQKEPMLLDQAEDALCVDGLPSGGSPLAPEERGDPPVAIGGPLVDPDGGCRQSDRCRRHGFEDRVAGESRPAVRSDWIGRPPMWRRRSSRGISRT